MRDYIKVKEDPTDKFNFWRVNHNDAVRNPLHGFETAILTLLDGLEEYRFRHQTRYDEGVENDYVLAEGVADIARGIRTLLNGEHGRLDAGTIDGYLVALLQRCRVAV